MEFREHQHCNPLPMRIELSVQIVGNGKEATNAKVGGAVHSSSCKRMHAYLSTVTFSVSHASWRTKKMSLAKQELVNSADTMS
jgi:hypothetical protein